MNKLSFKLEDFVGFMSHLRLSSPNYGALIESSKNFSVLDSCFLSVRASCCAKRNETNNACLLILRSFVLNKEENESFFNLLKRQMNLEKISFTDNGPGFGQAKKQAEEARQAAIKAAMDARAVASKGGGEVAVAVANAAAAEAANEHSRALENEAANLQEVCSF